MPLRQPVPPRQTSLPLAAVPTDLPWPVAAPTPPRLWLALHFSRLALDLVPPVEQAFVIHEPDSRRRPVYRMNRAARAAGITRGMPLAAALGLCGDLLTRPRDPSVEREALTHLAAWALRYSDHVSLEAPDTLLIEIGGSLRLFGGLERLLARMRDDLAAIGHHARSGIAPVPAGARLLAQAGIATPVRDLDTLARHLRGLPLGLLQQPAAVTRALHGLGLATLGDLMRLSRAGLARRLGPALLLQLDRLLGRHPDPQPRFEPPPRFARTLWLPAATTDAIGLQQALHRLLAELAGVLRGHAAGVQQLHIQLLHADAATDTLELGLLAPAREPERWLGPLAERLARHRLAAPVEGLRLQARHFIPLPHTDGELFARRAAITDGWPLIERLRARLGHAAVHGVQAVDDHRPERAWRSVEPGTPHVAGTLPPPGTRPLWLLAQPIPVRGRPACESAPERIESGWWDDGLARDYRVARNARGERSWLYRDVGGNQDVFVQGLFG